MSTPVEILTSLHKDLSDLKLFFLANYNSDKQSQRQALRTHLINHLQQFGKTTSTSLQDLLSLPTHDELSLSLSHCSDYSAFGWCAKPKRLGVDVESLLRLKKDIVVRVCTPEEIALAPRYEFLWSCKEAVFKALSPQINVLSFVDIFDWKSLHDETTTEAWQFSARMAQSKTPLSGRGEVRLILGHVFAFFIADS